MSAKNLRYSEIQVDPVNICTKWQKLTFHMTGSFELETAYRKD